MSLAAIVLAGGRATRLDGAAKPLLEVGGVSLLQTAVDAADAAGALPIIVAGPVMAAPDSRPDPRVAWIREDPPYGGPVAAILAALPLIQTRDVLLLAADLPRAGEAVSFLLEAAALASYGDGLCLTDESGRPQWLTGIYRTGALLTAARGMADDGAGESVRTLLADLEIATVRAPTGVATDIDTWEDLMAARRLAEPPEIPGGTMAEASRTLPPEALDAWAAALREKFDLTDEDLPIALILDLARDVAGGVARPAAPFSAFAAGLVAGRAGGSPADVEAAVASIVQLAATWDPHRDAAPSAGPGA